MYARPLHRGTPLTFGVSGMLWKDSLIMYDRQTRSLWSHVTGKAVTGPLRGTVLTVYPTAMQTTWEQWRRLHPGTLVLSKRGRLGGLEGTHDVYEDYFRSETRLGIFSTRNPDASLPGKEFVLGVSAGAARSAYPFRHLSVQPLVNDRVGAEPVVVVFAKGSATATAFSRRLGNRTLEFRELRAAGEDLQMTDAQTGSTWRALTGVAVAGKLKGERLGPVPATMAFWFAWRQIYPATAVWKPKP
ncbi:MAG: DUF3179 domain-containing protein [candidate division NC10 bacterium]|nr:DUF3179 domain-containing protein [candidate division NC10 bacterium]